MAIPLLSKPNTSAATSDYPYGNIKDNPGDNTGTPVNKLVYADFHQFFAKMLAESGVVANGLPDNDYSGFQYFEALLGVFGGIRRKIVEIGDWDMNADAIKNVAHGLPDHTKIRAVNVIIRNDTAGSNVYPLSYYGSGGIDGGITNITSSIIALNRAASPGIFDSTTFDSTSYNRGWVTIDYDATE